MGSITWTFWYCNSSHVHVKFPSCSTSRTSKTTSVFMWVPGQDETCHPQILSAWTWLQWPSSKAVQLDTHLWGGIKTTTRWCSWATWKACHIDTLCRCQPVPWCIDWKICHWYTAHVECHIHWLVLQEAGYCETATYELEFVAACICNE